MVARGHRGSGDFHGWFTMENPMNMNDGGTFMGIAFLGRWHVTMGFHWIVTTILELL